MIPSKKTTKKLANVSANATYLKVSFCYANKNQMQVMFPCLRVRIRVKKLQLLKWLMMAAQFSQEPQKFTWLTLASQTAFMKRYRLMKSKESMRKRSLRKNNIKRH